MKKIKNLTIGNKIVIVSVLLVIIVGGVATYFLTRSPIVFKADIIKVEINDSYDVMKNIAIVRNGNVKDVKADISKIDYNKLGRYPVIYIYKDKKYEATIEIVDTKKPQFDVVDLDIDLGMKVDPASMATNINDATKTEVSFKEDYDFSKEGTVEVIIQVKDKGNNVTEKKGKVKVTKDSEPPQITGLEPLTIVIGAKTDYNSGVSISDNRDPEPKLTVDSSNVNIQKEGTYTLIYIGIDRSGNKIEKQREIKVVEKPKLFVPKEHLGLIGGTLVYIAGIIAGEFDYAAIVYGIAYLLVGYKVILKALKNIRRGEVFDENFLMCIATIGAFCISDYKEAIAVMLFYSDGEIFQAYAVNKTRTSISSLMDLKSDYANLLVGEEIKKVAPEEIKIGDEIIVKVGEKVPLDGVVLEGASTLDTSSLTGETLPRNVSKGDEVLAGVVNLTGIINL